MYIIIKYFCFATLVQPRCVYYSFGFFDLISMFLFAVAYFTRGNYNIIIVDYSTLAQIPCLNQVEWAPRFCAMCIAQLANYLADHPRGVPPDKLHMMG